MKVFVSSPKTQIVRTGVRASVSTYFLRGRLTRHFFGNLSLGCSADLPSPEVAGGSRSNPGDSPPDGSAFPPSQHPACVASANWRLRSEGRKRTQSLATTFYPCRLAVSRNRTPQTDFRPQAIRRSLERATHLTGGPLAKARRLSDRPDQSRRDVTVVARVSSDSDFSSGHPRYAARLLSRPLTLGRQAQVLAPFGISPCSR